MSQRRANRHLRRAATVGIVLATLVSASGNVTVDDADLGIQYTAGWTVGNDCTACAANPNMSQIPSQTWHDVTHRTEMYNMGFTYSFHGTAIYLYGIVPLVSPFLGGVGLTFEIDNQTAGSYDFTATNGTKNEFAYQVPVFGKENLADGQHTVRLILKQNTMFLFDYLVYTATDPPPPPFQLSAGAAAGITLGAVLLLLAIGFCIFFLVRRGRSSRSNEESGRKSLHPRALSPSAVSAFPQTTVATNGDSRPMSERGTHGTSHIDSFPSAFAVLQRREEAPGQTNSKMQRQIRENAMLPAQMQASSSRQNMPAPSRNQNHSVYAGVASTSGSSSYEPSQQEELATHTRSTSPYVEARGTRDEQPRQTPGGGGGGGRVAEAAISGQESQAGLTRPPTLPPPPYIRSPPQSAYGGDENDTSEGSAAAMLPRTRIGLGGREKR